MANINEILKKAENLDENAIGLALLGEFDENSPLSKEQQIEYQQKNLADFVEITELFKNQN